MGLEAWRALPVATRAELRHRWRFWARPEQIAPSGDWRAWLFLAGRGTGKTRSGAEWVREQVAAGNGRVALVARTSADVRDVLVEGESGILACCPAGNRPRWEPSRRRLTWPSGAIATTYTADEPDQLRGPQHDAAWVDELAAWRFPDAWDQLLFGLRLGADPRVMVTTTPRPTPIIRGLLKASTTVVTRGSTYDNAANLAPAFLTQIVSRYEGTRLGRQELHAEILDDAPGALWQRAQIDAARVARAPERGFRAIVIAVDPATTSGDDSDETGIVVVGRGLDDHAYVLEDASGRHSVAEWSALVVRLFDEHRANRVIVETNQGGDMVPHTLHSVRASLPVTTIHASRGKRLRAEPVALLAEQGRVHHVGAFPELEDQLCSWSPDADESPDRLDAMVYAVSADLGAYQSSAGQEVRAAAEQAKSVEQRMLEHDEAEQRAMRAREQTRATIHGRAMPWRKQR